MFVSGVGGTGKSFLIETIKALECEEWPSKDITCAITAPTGLAAFNVGGVTIHRLFQLPVEHNSKTAGYWSLPKSSQKVIRSTLRSVKLFVMVEVYPWFPASIWLTFTSGWKSCLVVTSGSAERTCFSLETFSNCSPSMETLCFTTSLKLPLCTNLGVWRP